MSTKTTSSEDEKRKALQLDFAADPFLAHEVLFKVNHPHPSPPFHKELIAAYHSNHKHVIILTFRGSSKSTRLEEFAVLMAVQKLCNNIVIVGESWLRAVERLRSIKRELATNELLIWLYGPQEGELWSESRITLSNGVAISALGQGQALRGMKHHIYRPDLCLIDDLESADTVATPEARAKLRDWFWSDLIPALSPDYRLRMTATPLNPESLAVVNTKLSSFKSIVVPIRYVDENGSVCSSWPSRFPLSLISQIEEDYKAAGVMHKFTSEYMVQAVDPGLQTFKPEYFRFEDREHSWEPVMVSIDPARTVSNTSATTGVAVVSFLNNKLIVWEARPERYTPREIIDEIFRLEAKYRPVVIGVEQDGLHEFLMQPIREEQLKRKTILPIKPLKAPKGKMDFIARLQPLFASGSVVFAGAKEKYKAAIDQFLSFPSGLVDVPNAMAYIFALREGVPIYQDASYKHIGSTVMRDAPFILAVNADGYGTAGVLFQYYMKVLQVHCDFVHESPPGEVLNSIVEEARLAAQRPLRVIAPPFHFEVRNSFGLLAAARGVADILKGGDAAKGRELIRELLRGEAMGMPRLVIGPDAPWVKRALFGGYVWDAGRTKPVASLYNLVMGALEAAVALAQASPAAVQRTAIAPDGTRYVTAQVSWR
jgi:hypothetical protein